MQLLHTDNVVLAERVARVIAACGPANAVPPLQQILQNEAVPAEARIIAAKGLAGSERGARWLLKRAAEGELYPEARFVVGSTLRSSNKPDIRDQALQLFPAPTMKSKEPLPELAELVKMNGDAELGATLFKTTGTCANCHVLGKEGKNVGPDLSEIGSKLAKESLYISILDPSAGISHNYESWAALTDSGQVVVGLMVSQTDDEVVLKDAEGIERRLPRDEIEELKKMDKSLMPENIIENLSTADLVNLVEFLTTLKKKS
jgi:putative heme-binding domain-containing protein